GLVFGGAYSGTIDLGDGLRTSRGGADAFVSVADVTTKAIETFDLGDTTDDAMIGIAGSPSAGIYVAGVLETDLGAPACNFYPLGGVGFLRRL
ncbi:MAG: hypothetical protein AB7T06_36455, partial [Kofleriaceae bacterium]